VLHLHVPYYNLNHNPSYRISHYFAIRPIIILKRYSYSYVDSTFVSAVGADDIFYFALISRLT